MENTKNTKSTTQKEIKEKPLEEEAGERKQEVGKKEQKDIQQKTKRNKMPLTIFLFLLIAAIIKDVIEIILGVIALLIPVLAPIIIFFSWIISLPFTAFIFFITLLSGIRATWLFTGLIIDQIPILPAATLTVILCYIFEKSPAPVKETIKKASKLPSLKNP